ncbi:MAG: hypothetical protein FE834_05505, partial [Gammaproteobacteria bacterium]|nr:hypothetical protein [Gammaproteobacteria bacterium]
MDQEKKRIIKEIHNKALGAYQRYHKHTQGTFYLRKSNRASRLDDGYWFQGNDDYVFTSPFKPADNHNKTQRFGFVITSKKKCYLEFAYGDFSKQEHKYEAFYKEVLEYFDVEYDELSNKHSKEIVYSSTQNWSTELEKFLHNDVEKLIKIAKKYDLPDEYLFFSKSEFEKRLSRSQKIQKQSENLIFENMEIPLNQILYGPPGTGKTYSTVEYALKILDAEDKKDDIKSIGQLKKEFGSQVEFVTFHQSFSYEDFVEGLKATTDNGKISYVVKNGVFKQICENAVKQISITIDGKKQKFTEEMFIDFYKKYVEKNLKDIPKTKANAEPSYVLKTERQNKEFNLYKNSSDSIVVKSGGEQTNQSITSNQLSKVLFDDKAPNLASYEQVIIDDILKDYKVDNTSKKPHILIIDEINRGNIS